MEHFYKYPIHPDINLLESELKSSLKLTYEQISNLIFNQPLINQMVKFTNDNKDDDEEKGNDFNYFYGGSPNEEEKDDVIPNSILIKKRRSCVRFASTNDDIEETEVEEKGIVNKVFENDEDYFYNKSSNNEEKDVQQLFTNPSFLNVTEPVSVRRKSIQFINNALFSPIVEFTIGMDNNNNNNNAYTKRKSIAVDPELSRRNMLLRGRPSVFQTMARVQKKLGIKHYVLVLLLALYAIIGGLIFYLLESNEEIMSLERNRETINLLINDLAVNILEISNDNSQTNEQKRELSIFLIRETYKDLLIVENKYAGSTFHKFERVNIRLTWYFSSAIFYSMTLFTSIGYGTIACQTVAGKVITIIYASIGIPLMLVVLGDIGDVLLSWFIFIYNWCYHKFRRTWNLLLIKINFDKYLIKNDDDQDFPFIGSVIIIIFYMLFISMVIYLADFSDNQQGLSFGDAFYFTFISMTTIGLGDVYPNHKSIEFNPIIPLLFLFGLALLSVVNSTMYSKMQNKFLFAVEKIEFYLENLTINWKKLLTCGLKREHPEGWETLRCLRRNIELLTISVPLFDDNIEVKISKMLDEEKKDKPKIRRTRTVSQDIRPTLGILRAGIIPVIAERTGRERSATDNSLDKLFQKRILDNLNKEETLSLEKDKKSLNKRGHSFNEANTKNITGNWKSQIIIPKLIMNNNTFTKTESKSLQNSRRNSINTSTDISININNIEDEDDKNQSEKIDSLPIIEEEPR
ncbi:Potassium channel subfamily K member 18 [Strongyloides ratti]|uniref:Potassium channel subfamily K member 18 n=1 Tax=Strongyloides ratti TaxID=34506 RepID=A0A090L8Q5_STRRB|nr:Potassium channel subfamily K member 18 [Strongyloides ratti]CEF66146.1 Potassium channel subfamily K member 18 [Strongyloides ratti]